MRGDGGPGGGLLDEPPGGSSPHRCRLRVEVALGAGEGDRDGLGPDVRGACAVCTALGAGVLRDSCAGIEFILVDAGTGLRRGIADLHHLRSLSPAGR